MTVAAMAKMANASSTAPSFHQRGTAVAPPVGGASVERFQLIIGALERPLVTLTRPDADGSALLGTDEVAHLLQAAVGHNGGLLRSWRLDHIDAQPGQATTATYAAVVEWRFGRRSELLGASARAGDRTSSDEQAVIFANGSREVAVWLYPNDPDLPGLRRTASASAVAELFNEFRVLPHRVGPDQVGVEIVGYRPRRRAVLRVCVRTSVGPSVWYVKVLRARSFAATVRRHELLLDAGLPVPSIAAATSDHVLILRELAGQPLAAAMFDPLPPCQGEDVLDLLDRLPTAVLELPPRAPWVEGVDFYADMVAAALPARRAQLSWLVESVRSADSVAMPGDQPTHGDFHEGQLLVSGGVISGLLDVDTVGPGRRVDDLACLLAHLVTVQRMNTKQGARLQRLVRSWMPAFDACVDPVELRLRAAGVIISLATGPYRGQEPRWEAETMAILDAAERLVRAAG
jgi:hypothetical protein